MGNKIQITEAKLRKVIREEGEKVKKEFILRYQLQKIEEELTALNEVHAGGQMAPGADGVHAGQRKAEFTKKGTHLIEKEEEEEVEPAMEPEMGGEMDDEMGSSEEAPEMGMDTTEIPAGEEDNGSEMISKEEVKSALQSVGNSLDLTGSIEFVGLNGEENGEELTIDMDGDSEGGEMGDSDINVDDVEIETGVEDAPGAESGDDEIEECGDGVMEKKTAPVQKTAAPVQETTKKAKPVLAENAAPANKKLNEERERMKYLAGLLK